MAHQYMRDHNKSPHIDRGDNPRPPPHVDHKSMEWMGHKTTKIVPIFMTHSPVPTNNNHLLSGIVACLANVRSRVAHTLANKSRVT